MNRKEENNEIKRNRILWKFCIISVFYIAILVLSVLAIMFLPINGKNEVPAMKSILSVQTEKPVENDEVTFTVKIDNQTYQFESTGAKLVKSGKTLIDVLGIARIVSCFLILGIGIVGAILIILKSDVGLRHEKIRTIQDLLYMENKFSLTELKLQDVEKETSKENGNEVTTKTKKQNLLAEMVKKYTDTILEI